MILFADDRDPTRPTLRAKSLGRACASLSTAYDQHLLGHDSTPAL
jgi:hypothetical protein